LPVKLPPDQAAPLRARRLMRGIFRSVDDLKAAINRFVAQNNGESARATPAAWRY
jgi:hypothetical protein